MHVRGGLGVEHLLCASTKQGGFLEEKLSSSLQSSGTVGAGNLSLIKEGRQESADEISNHGDLSINHNSRESPQATKSSFSHRSH